MRNKTKKEILNILRSREFVYRTLEIVESVLAYSFLSRVLLDESIVTIDDWAKELEEQKRQQTTVVSVQVAYVFEGALLKACKEFGLDALKKEEGESAGHDFRIRTSDGDIMMFEVKTTQNVKGWTGSTHSEGKGKADNYVLINYGLDKDLPIPTDGSPFTGVINAIHVSVLDSECNVDWNGEATDRNSSTTGKIPAYALEAYKKSIVFGSAKPNRKWCKIIREKLDIKNGGIDVKAA